jgi:putative thioredoxin
MIDVTIQNFDAQVMQASMSTAVLVDFWAPWCGPCKSLGPVLEQLEVEYAGRFTLAKVNSDEEQELSTGFGIRSIPTCVLVIGGKPKDGFTGAQSAAQVRAFLDKNLPPALEDDAPEEEVAAEPATPSQALEHLQHALATDLATDDTRFDYVRLLLQLGRSDDAKVAFAPVIAKAASSRKLEALQRWINAIDFVAAHTHFSSSLADLIEKIATNKRDFDSRFAIAQIHMAAGHWTHAMDELLEILMRDKTWSEDKARKTYIAILEIIEPPKVKVADGQIPPQDATVATYRRRLSSVVLS